MACNYNRMLQCIYVNKEFFILFTKSQPTGKLRPQNTPKNFTGHTDNEKCNTWGLEVTAIPRRVKV